MFLLLRGHLAFLHFFIDVGCFGNGTTCSGYLTWDHTALVRFAATRLEKFSISSLLAEALALRWCPQWALDTDLETPIIIEAESKSVINCIKGKLSLL